ncbi:ABC transporter ATP-binding protein [Sphingomonas antarctica]|uniref:ABC transporter ATP-binding protein n=1 Tax=Sphingomonas antarctica TaxID=2040274 RepID=UPI0039E8BC90
MATDPPLLETRALDKDYQLGGETVHAVAGVSLSVARGEFVAIMGASGSGKSTFMNMIGALDVPTRGQLLLDGVDIGSLSSDELAAIRNRKIGFVFQQFNLLPRTSALDNVATPLIYAGLPRAERHQRAAAKLEAMGLAERSHHTPAKLSGGQQQRVAIARALVTEPLMLLADEPTGALDTATSDDIMGLFQRLNDDGITVIVVTHEPDVAQYASRRVLFRDGRVIEDAAVTNRRRSA